MSERPDEREEEERKDRREDTRRTAVAAALILALLFGLALVLPTLTMLVAGWTPYPMLGSLIVPTLFVALFFGIFWARSRARR